ncbi:Piwi-domain-containing protein [Athelia psychrophila]|uniref:Piwi-domain-containing protein n=1 Tax=Athelia psychrophila TaxID=1759441 RepID=A0A166M4U6_9AGAM|nr:Piwi-domain-containing protein [Fibularhizoctonia sp. CBS 109695]
MAAFHEELKIRARRIELVDQLQSAIAPTIFQPKALYDGGSILFAPRQLQLPDGNTGSFVIGKFTIRVALTIAETVDFGILYPVLRCKEKESSASEVAINLTNLLIQAAPSLMQAGAGSQEVNYVRAARKMLTSFDKRDIGGGLEFWQGIFQSIRPAVDRLLVNVDVTNGIMYHSGELTDVVMAFLKTRNLHDLILNEGDEKFKKVKSFLKGLFVTVPHLKKRIKIQSLQPYAGEYVFTKDDQEELTVAKHYKDAHKINISNPKFFGIVAGSKDRRLVFPIQVCKVLGGQLYKKKLSPDATAKVVPLATKAPQARMNTIMNGIGHGKPGAISSPGVDYASSPFLKIAGMSIAPDLLEINGNVVKPPNLTFGRGQIVNPEHGRWDMRNKQFYEAAPGFTRLTIVDCSHSPDNRLTTIYEGLNAMFKSLGKRPVEREYRRSNGHDLERVLQVEPAPQILLCLLPGDASAAADLYRKIKFTCDVRMGILSQCVLVDKISKVQPQYLNNIALKINARLRGSNLVPHSPAIMELKKTPVMLIGADVSHPGPGAQQPSIVALTWSHEPNLVKFKARATVQPPRVEIIEKLQGMMKFAIFDFADSARAPPARLIFYRDGVSEGEYDIVQQTEIEAVLAAIDECHALWVSKGLLKPTAAKPKLTFIIVGKGHHIRFFPKNGMGEDRNGNCPAGFLAGEGLQSPFTPASGRRDFYLQSHGSIQGTSRPAHYIVLRDENFNGFPHILEELTFAFCHSYASCTRSVSIPAPTYYADKACTHAKYQFQDFTGTESTVSDNDEFNIEVWKSRFKPLQEKLEHRMWFL